MQAFLLPLNWLPFVWILIQAYLCLSIVLFFLRRLKMLVVPISGMEYGDIVIAGSLLLGSLFLSTATTASIFQAAKTFQYAQDQVLQNTLLKFTEYFIAAVLSIAILLAIGVYNKRMFFKTTEDDDLNEGNLAWGLLIAFINVGFATVMWYWLKEFGERITPEFVNFR